MTTVTRTVARTVTETTTVTASAPAGADNQCTARDLTATFEVLQGSAGAGNIVYTLRVQNASQHECTVGGVPDITFVGHESHIPATNSGVDSFVTLQPGDSARSQVRFSPDVDPCQPGTASTLRLTMPDGTTLDAKIDPPTKLCGGGSLQPSAFTGAD
jgi:hypothetical protein